MEKDQKTCKGRNEERQEEKPPWEGADGLWSAPQHRGKAKLQGQFAGGNVWQFSISASCSLLPSNK